MGLNWERKHDNAKRKEKKRKENLVIHIHIVVVVVPGIDKDKSSPLTGDLPNLYVFCPKLDFHPFLTFSREPGH